MFDVLKTVGAFIWSSLRWFQPVVVQMKKELLYCLVFEWGSRKDVELRVACL